MKSLSLILRKTFNQTQYNTFKLQSRDNSNNSAASCILKKLLKAASTHFVDVLHKLLVKVWNGSYPMWIHNNNFFRDKSNNSASSGILTLRQILIKISGFQVGFQQANETPSMNEILEKFCMIHQSSKMSSQNLMEYWFFDPI